MSVTLAWYLALGTRVCRLSLVDEGSIFFVLVFDGQSTFYQHYLVQKYLALSHSCYDLCTQCHFKKWNFELKLLYSSGCHIIFTPSPTIHHLPFTITRTSAVLVLICMVYCVSTVSVFSIHLQGTTIFCINYALPYHLTHRVQGTGYRVHDEKCTLNTEYINILISFGSFPFQFVGLIVIVIIIEPVYK